jgi:murein DD-endopeptidase MepM/ murein hydrolase activator NlpD
VDRHRVHWLLAVLIGWGAPLDPLQVARPFIPPVTRYSTGHRGVDLAGLPGDIVRSAGAGRVAFAGRIAGVDVISIDHGHGLRTTYEPVTALVHRQEVVARGTPIGLLLTGHPGCRGAACLHWGLRVGHDYLNPLLLLGRGAARLVPP